MRAGKPASSLLALGLLAATAALAAEAPRVREIEVRMDAPLAQPLELRSLLAFAPGERLDDAAVRRSLSNLYATGLVSEAEISSRPAEAPAGEEAGSAWVDAVVAIWGQTWAETVELEGELGLKRSVLERVVTQQPGAPLVEEKLLRSHYALQTLYARRGYREARVRLVVEPRPEGRRARVVYRLESGPRARIGEIRFEGDVGPFDAAELRRALGIESGAGYDFERLEAHVERLEAWLRKRGHAAATVPMPREIYDPDSDLVDLVFQLAVGPRIEVMVEGEELRRLEKRGLLPFLRDGPFDVRRVEQAAGRIETFLQRQGHYRAEVRHEIEEEEGLRRVLLEIERGPRYELAEIAIEGNENVTDAVLLDLMTTSERRFLSGGSGLLVDEDLAADLANLRSYYLLRGFPEVEVGPAEVAAVDGDDDGGELRLIIPVREGPRQRVVGLTLEGNRALASDDLVAVLPLAPGGPYHPVLLADSLDVVRTLYEERGYPALSVTPRLDWNAERTLVDVHLEIYEGPRTLVDRVILRGYRHTRPEFLRRLIELEPGEPVSRRRLLEVERDLYRQGIFSRVDVELAPSAESSERRDVIVRLEEGRRWRLAYGVSYHSDDGIGGLLSLSRANLGGRGDRLQLDLRASTNDRRFRLIYDQPLLWGRKIPITYALFQQREERESFTTDDLGVQVSLLKDFGSLRAGVVYDYRLVDLSAETIDPGEIDRQNRDLEISSLTPNLFLDRRDDPLDPTRGWSTSLQLEWAFPLLTADADFLKLFWQQTYYLPLGPPGLLATSVRFGAIEPFDPAGVPDPLVPPGLASADIPVSERFFAGGRTSHRAFERDQLGIPGRTLVPREDADPLELGGNGLLIWNLDYRFPITGPVGGTLFTDLGNVWADWRDVDADDLELGAGLGVRYRSPIGPVRLEVGWKIDSALDDGSPVFFLSFGNPF